MGYYSQAHICQCLTRLSTLRAKSVVAITGSRHKTGQEFVEEVMSLAQGLRIHVGLQEGDVVAICAFNSDWYLEWLLAVAFAGGIVAPLNYRWSFEEAKLAMLSVRPMMLVADESCNHWHSAFPSNIMPSLKWHVSLGSSPSGFTRSLNPLTTETLRNHAKIAPVMDPRWAPDGAAIVCFTSGTTGRPKGVIISHSALIVQSLAKVAIVGYSEDDVYLHTAPLCHIGGLSSALATLMVGACHVLIPKFEASLAMDAMEQHHVTSFITVPAMMSDLISLMRRKTSWKGSQYVTKILNGGGSLTVELTKDATKIFPRAKILSAYGMTETCSSLTFMTLHDPTLQTPGEEQQISGNAKSISIHRPHGVCVGKPAPHVELKICADVPSHPVGTILTRGPHVMLGYWDQSPEKTLCSSDEAWLDTGDIGAIDNDGNVWLIGRVNGRIKSGGENVYPEEVEAILLQHPGVSDTVIVGIPDARLGEMVVACIKLRETWQWVTDSRCRPCDGNKQLLCGDILEKHCKAKHLTGFKVPKQFIMWSKAFPLTSTGKIRREQVGGEVVSYLQSFSSRL